MTYGGSVIGMLLAPIFLFLVGFLVGLVLGSGMGGPGRITIVVLLWLTIVAVPLLQYAEVLEPGTLGTITFLLPRAVTYPLLGMLVGFSLRVLLTGSRR